MAVLKLSQIAAAGSAPSATDQVVGVTGGTTDNLYTIAQIGASAVLTINTTPISGGTNTRVFFDDAGVVQESAGLTFTKGNAGTTSALTIGGNASLFGEAANTLALRNGTNAQTFRVYGTTDGVPTNYDYLQLTKAAGGTATISTVKGGSGTAGDITIAPGSLTTNSTAHFIPSSLATYSLGSLALPWYQVFMSAVAINANVTSAAGSLAPFYSAANPANGNGIILVGYGNSSSEAAGIVTMKTRAATTAASTTVNSGDRLLTLVPFGANGTNYQLGGLITIAVDGTPSSTSMPGRWEFYTTPSGSNTPVLRWGIDNAGLLFAFGQTSSFPALKRSSATLQVRLADDSADAAMTAAGGTFSGALINTGITADTAHTDSTVCQDTTSHQFYSGTGTLGICLGTSGKQFKTNLDTMPIGIDEIMKIPLYKYRYRPGWGDNGAREQYGTTAQDIAQVLPQLVGGRDESGEPINYDYGALLFVAIRAIQQLKENSNNLGDVLSAIHGAMKTQQEQIDDLKRLH